MYNVSQLQNLGHLGELLGGAEGLLEAVSFNPLKPTVAIWVHYKASCARPG